MSTSVAALLFPVLAPHCRTMTSSGDYALGISPLAAAHHIPCTAQRNPLARDQELKSWAIRLPASPSLRHSLFLGPTRKTKLCIPGHCCACEGSAFDRVGPFSEFGNYRVLWAPLHGLTEVNYRAPSEPEAIVGVRPHGGKRWDRVQEYVNLASPPFPQRGLS